MSRSRKDGRKRGGHVDMQCHEIWSRRCQKVSGDRLNRWSKTVTHRLERRAAARDLRRRLLEEVA